MRAKVNGITLAYDDVGDGIPVLFVHGFPLNRRMWAPQCGVLSGAFRCILPDLRAFGESDVAPPFSIDQYADDLAGLLDTLAVDERVVVIGLSLGGYVAFAFWRRHREKVRALILCDTRAGADAPEALEKRRQTIRLARERGSAAVADVLVGGMVGATTRERRSEIVEHLRAMMAAAPVEGIVGASEAMMGRPDSAPLLPAIDVPTLVVVGEEDSLTPPLEAAAMRAAIPGSRIEVIPGAGHVSNMERPAAFNHALSDFLAVLSDSAASA
ncbi:MAG: alpha/beta hydrolase [Gemmatimonadota bacterium]|nr:alpha/beta hydrolase [Gemmatimonadota bacterium]